MIFTEPRFLLFFLVVFALHWTLRGLRARKILLLAASYLFYAAWDWRFLGLLIATTVIDFLVGLALRRTEEPRARRAWFLVSLVSNLGVLGYFKYFGFFVQSAHDLLAAVGLPAPSPVTEIVLPVGISFYVFHSLSYTFDIYRREIEPTRSLLDFSLSVAFFPQLVAGPIVRARQLLPQLLERKRLADVRFRWPLVLFLIGFVKKACVADRLALVADPVFADPGAFDAGSNWLATLLFQIQLYCDFSGYSDMAIATAAMLGYALPQNFDFPYLSRSFTDFWRRWHISLATWMRDYLYVPLGGSRAGGARAYLNILATFAIVGLWHGARWTFVAFGLAHGLYLCVERWFTRNVREEAWTRRLAWHAGIPLLTFFLAFTLVAFRAPDLQHLGTQARILYTAGGAGAGRIEPAWWWAVAAFAVVHVAMYRRLGFEALARLSDWTVAILLGLGAALAAAFAARVAEPFVYFQF